MDGAYSEGWFQHPNFGLLKIHKNSGQTWVYECYTTSGSKAVSKERPLDLWIWTLCQPDKTER